MSQPNGAPIQEDDRLTVSRKAVFGLGDFSVNTVLASLSLVYTLYFLTKYGELRPALAGLVPLIGRSIDAFTDPLMGRLSDLTSWRFGRRRPYLLLGAIPLGVFFALLWVQVPLESQGARFGYYASVYVAVSLSMTVLSVPYLALIPEMARTYDGRTSLHVFRNIGSTLGIFVAIALRPIATAVGGGEESGEALAQTAAGFGVLITVCAIAVYGVSYERPEFQIRETALSLREGLNVLMRHRTYTQLMSFYLTSRVAMDLISMLLILYFTHVLGRTSDFELTMALFLVTVVASMPLWLAASRRYDKASMFVVGATWWAVGNLGFLFVEPDWPRWIVLGMGPVIAIGFASADLLPWSMLADVVDEDDLATGERREGLYTGFFTFLRKLGGAVAGFGAGLVLDAAGLPKGNEPAPQSAVDAVRWMAALGPTGFLVWALWLARRYPLSRRRHAEILAALEERDHRRT